MLNYIAEGVKRKIFNWTDVKEDIRLRLLFCNYRKASISAQKHETFLSYLNALSDRRFSDIVNAKSEIIMIDDNLNSSRAEAICRNLGVDCSWFLAKSVIIDQRLLDHRNCFAHGASRLRGGELVDYADSSLWECVDEVRALIRHTKDQFQNSINIRSFLS